MEQKSFRDDIFQYAATQYGTAPEYLWLSAPGYAVLRHGDNRKWYALIMDVKREKLGLPGDGYVDILELKLDPIMLPSLTDGKGILPAYHMNRANWITVLLDGSVELDTIYTLLNMSFDITSSRKPASPPR